MLQMGHVLSEPPVQLISVLGVGMLPACLWSALCDLSERTDANTDRTLLVILGDKGVVSLGC